MSEEENKGTANAGAQGGAPQSNGLATASLVLGIISIVLCWIWVVGVIAGILAIILAIVAKNKIKSTPNMGGKGAANGGLITGIIGTIIALVIVIAALMFVDAAAGALEEGFNSQEFKDAMEKGLEDANNNNK
ncbi:MAG: DUF4190 domain-containing protein [Bacteroidota bacterium]